MSWLFSRALAEEFLQATCLGGEQSAPLNVMLTQHRFWRNDKMMDASRLSQFGQMCAPLTENLGKELLTSYLAAFPVRTFLQQGQAPASREKDLGSGVKWRGLLAKYDLDSCSWKTAQCSLLEDLEEFSATWPRLGMTRNGNAYPLLTLGLNTNATEYGLWPTPTVHGNHNRPKQGTKSGTGLATAVKKWPTPTASMSKGTSANTLIRKNGKSRVNDRLDHRIFYEERGQLNPRWVEWLMGWPIGWTSLKPLEMDRFREWQRQHSNP